MSKSGSNFAAFQRRLRRLIAGMTAITAWLLVTTDASHAGSWITDPHSLCQVWDPNPQVDESAAWSGSCAGGRAEGPGSVQWLKGGRAIETDKGAWRNGRQVGKGVQTWSTGRYEGELANGEPNGHGVLSLGHLRYEGQFRDGKPNGMGTLTEGSQTIQGTWKDGCLQSSARKAWIGVPLSASR